MEKTQTLPTIAAKVVTQATSKDVVVPTTHPYLDKFVKELTDRLHEGTAELTKNKGWIRAQVDNGRIVFSICGPLRKNKVIKDGKTVDSVHPQFSIGVPVFSAKTLGPMLPHDNFNVAQANKDFLKRLALAAKVMLQIYEEVEFKTFGTALEEKITPTPTPAGEKLVTEAVTE